MALESRCSRLSSRIPISNAKPAEERGWLMTKRQADKLHTLRRALVAHTFQMWLARKHDNMEIETEVSLEREITLCQIENHKKGIR